MTKRQSRHSDNRLIDKAGDLPTPGQGSRSGGTLATRVGTRAELQAALGEEPSVERVTGNDDPDADAVMGSKSRAKSAKPNQ
jgi:hypothetical protein